jgi:hypothetical protein
VEVVTLPTPPVSVAVPKEVAPLVNDTVPVTPEAKLAVSVTDCPEADGFADEVTDTVGCAFVTVWVVVPVAELKFVSPA